MWLGVLCCMLLGLFFHFFDFFFPADWCLLFVASCLSCDVSCLLSVDCCALFVVCCRLFIACCLSLFVAWWCCFHFLRIVSCLLLLCVACLDVVVDCLLVV